MRNNVPEYIAESAYKGFKGKMIIVLMGVMHKRMHRQIAGRMNILPDDRILDIGCGSGELAGLLAKQTSGQVSGIDYSPDMVKTAEMKNKKPIAQGKIHILQASVSKLPFDKASIDKAVAFETIQFWPDIIDDLKEVNRVLTQSGALYIANRFPKPGSKWYNWVKLKTEDDYREALIRAGFKRILTDTNTMRNMIVVEAYKNKE